MPSTVRHAADEFAREILENLTGYVLQHGNTIFQEEKDWKDFMEASKISWRHLKQLAPMI